MGSRPLLRCPPVRGKSTSRPSSLLYFRKEAWGPASDFERYDNSSRVIVPTAFKSNGKVLKERGYRPVPLIIREDNLATAMTACATGGWTVLQGQATFDYIKELSSFDLLAWLKACKASQEFFINKV